MASTSRRYAIDPTDPRASIRAKVHFMMNRRIFTAAMAATTLALALPASAQTWPDKPIHFVVAAGPGSSLDTLARVIGEKLKDRLGQPVVIGNKPAAGGTVATSDVARAAADG